MDDGGSLLGSLIGGLISLAIALFYIYCIWRIYTKADKPGWSALVPIYGGIVMLEIVGKPIWWIVLFLIPGVGFIAGLLVTISLAKSFGKGAGYGLGLIFLSPIFVPMLAFGDTRYQGPAG